MESGKSNVTLGGAVASDTHGKDNLWGGSFIKNVKEKNFASFWRSDCSIKKVNPEIFYSTVGGYGLTGVILGLNLFKNNIPISNSFNTKVFTGSNIDNLLQKFENSSNFYWVELDQSLE